MENFMEHNVYTSIDPTLYGAQISPEAIKEAIDKLSTMPSIDLNYKGWQTAAETNKKTEPTKDPIKPVEKWIWVEGYKGTNKDMQGHGDYQFEIGKRYDMPTNVEIRACHSGFHLSLNMKDVFKHYQIGKGNRFFKVKALVREEDFNKYGKEKEHKSWFDSTHYDKLASQSIEFIRELTIDEIFQDTEYKDWSEAYKAMAIAGDLVDVQNMVRADELVTLGFSKPFAMYIIEARRFDRAKAIASQSDLSMDMKAYLIMR